MKPSFTKSTNRRQPAGDTSTRPTCARDKRRHDFNGNGQHILNSSINKHQNRERTLQEQPRKLTFDGWWSNVKRQPPQHMILDGRVTIGHFLLTNKILIGTCYFLFSRQWTPVTYLAAPGLRKIYAGLPKYWEIKVYICLLLNELSLLALFPFLNHFQNSLNTPYEFNV
jgi:hypothetical protein